MTGNSIHFVKILYTKKELYFLKSQGIVIHCIVTSDRINISTAIPSLCKINWRQSPRLQSSLYTVLHRRNCIGPRDSALSRRGCLIIPRPSLTCIFNKQPHEPAHHGHGLVDIFLFTDDPAKICTQRFHVLPVWTLGGKSRVPCTDRISQVGQAGETLRGEDGPWWKRRKWQSFFHGGWRSRSLWLRDWS